MRNPRSLKLPQLADRDRRGAFLGFDAEHDNCIVYLSLETSEIMYSDDYVLLEDYYAKTEKRTDYYGMDSTCSTAYKSLEMYKSHPFKHGISHRPIARNTRRNRFLQRVVDSEGEIDDDESSIEDDDSEVDYFADPDRFDLETDPELNSVVISKLKVSKGGLVDHVSQRDHNNDIKLSAHSISPLMSAPATAIANDDKFDRFNMRLLNRYDEGFDMNEILRPRIIMNVQSRIVDGKVFYLPQNLREAMNSES